MEEILTHAKLSRDAWQHRGDPRFVFYTDTPTDTEICIFKGEKNCIVIFKYSDSDIDWSYSFKSNLVPVPWDAGSGDCCNQPKIHQGFLEKFQTVQKWIEGHIEDANAVSFTGFSLGGALATLASSYFITKTYKFFPGENSAGSERFSEQTYFNKRKEVKCFIFGSPRVGNNSFVHYYNNRVNCKSVVYKNDPIPTLPPRMSCYRHIQKPLWLNENYKVEFSLRPSSLNTKLFINWVLRNICKCKCVKDSYPDHNISLIIDFLEHIVDT